jgi:hypothetical protein
MLLKPLSVLYCILFLWGILSCRNCPKNPPDTTYIHYGECKSYNEYLFLKTVPDSVFYFTGPGLYPGSVICGDWHKSGDSLLLTVEYPFTYELKKSFQHYENYKSQDSLYFIFFGLNPKIIHINSIYPSIESDLLLDCSGDTLPTPLSFSTKRLKGWTFNDTVIISKEYYHDNVTDTILITLDRLKGIIDSLVPVSFKNANCVKIYLSKIPIFNNYYDDLPTRYLIKSNKLITVDEKDKKIIFIKLNDNCP